MLHIVNKPLYVVVLALLLVSVSGCSTLNQDVGRQEPVVTPPRDASSDDLRAIISKEEKNKGIPTGILNSIAAVESRHNAYAVNAKRKSHTFKTKDEAVKFINTTLSSGCKNISVGCLQIHYRTHKGNFSSVADMLTPERNIAYAAALLKKLRDRYGSWDMAIRMYHTNKAKYNKPYYSKVMKAYNTTYKVS